MNIKIRKSVCDLWMPRFQIKREAKFSKATSPSPESRTVHVSTRQRQKAMQKQSYFQGRCCNRLAMCSGNSLAHIINSWSSSRATAGKKRLRLCISIHCHWVMWPAARAEGIPAGPTSAPSSYKRFSEQRPVERYASHVSRSVAAGVFPHNVLKSYLETQKSRRPRETSAVTHRRKQKHLEHKLGLQSNTWSDGGRLSWCQTLPDQKNNKQPASYHRTNRW